MFYNSSTEIFIKKKKKNWGRGLREGLYKYNNLKTCPLSKYKELAVQWNVINTRIARHRSILGYSAEIEIHVIYI